MSLTVLNVAYPFTAVTRDAAGGAEQVLAQLDAGLVRAGHRSNVIACDGSRVAGSLVAVPSCRGAIDAATRDAACGRHRRAIAEVLERWPVDVVHLHGVDFHTYLPAGTVPTLVTLHLPPAWYADEAFAAARPGLHFNCVSDAENRAYRAQPNLLPPIANGVPVAELHGRHARRSFGLILGRICPEKGIHLGLEAAHRAGVPLLVGGKVFPYDEHRRYFEREVRPRLDGRRAFLGHLDFGRKRRFLSAARFLLVPSTAPETGCLVAMEALACGTPVIGFANGALPEVIDDGKTGFLVRTVEEMAAAIARVGEIDRERCRAVARARFGVERMVEAYFAVYARLARQHADAPATHSLAWPTS